jgi:nucleotide-binding universal stress UspA family protein
MSSLAGRIRAKRRAIRDALPFLHEASSVTVVEISESGEETIAQGHVDDVVRYLMRHRIKAIPRIVQQQGTGAAQLIKLAQEAGAGLMVTGAYGHSRLGEWFFGGVTSRQRRCRRVLPLAIY